MNRPIIEYKLTPKSFNRTNKDKFLREKKREERKKELKKERESLKKQN
ncbi:hypothetical protein [Clostridium sp. CCUG 7971]|nr:hypothetical protein [Clostridium sp. CCUG 7971]MBO3443842.1 hypothetical protein [Clostridium sp. CCUG 7971]